MKRFESIPFRIFILSLISLICFTACTPHGGETGTTVPNTTEATNQNNDPSEETSKKEDNTAPPPADTVGWEIGNICPMKDLSVMGEDITGYAESYNIFENRGKITVINFWHTTCTPCLEEMPHLNSIATEYADNVTVLALHADLGGGLGRVIVSTNHIRENQYYKFAIRFGFDYGDAYYKELGGTGFYPRTLVIDKDGRVAALFETQVSYEDLKAVLDPLLAN